MFTKDDLIFAYTRSQAIDDGFLVDVTETAKEAGIKYPVALTRAVWCQYVEVPEGVSGQDEAGRLWDVLFMLATVIRRSRERGQRLYYQLYVRNGSGWPTHVTLKALCGPGDDGGPCITVMLPKES